MMSIQISPDSVDLAHKVAEHLIALCQQAVRDKGLFTLALAGGSTPKAAYQLLASPGYASQVTWPKVQIFWGDERCVPPNNPESNYRMVRETLLDHIPIPAANIHRMEAELDPSEAARRYEDTLLGVLKNPPRFDLILLGMGTDGHTASLFPGTPALDENSRWVVANFVPKQSSWRLTLTPGTINLAQNIAFIVAGEPKAAPLQQVINGKYLPEIYPSQLVKPQLGHLTWFVDKPAAKLLES
ncbi:MAG: 6-phosphogluconolactonase [Anaerolineales bacterium]|nr:6-phosphogluconolactonase [Anaerolineales bacterium]